MVFMKLGHSIQVWEGFPHPGIDEVLQPWFSVIEVSCSSHRVDEISFWTGKSEFCALMNFPNTVALVKMVHTEGGRRRDHHLLNLKTAMLVGPSIFQLLDEQPVDDRVYGSHLLLKSNEDDFMMLLNRDHKDKKWGIPGGKANSGESYIATLIRELDEEKFPYEMMCSWALGASTVCRSATTTHHATVVVSELQCGVIPKNYRLVRLSSVLQGSDSEFEPYLYRVLLSVRTSSMVRPLQCSGDHEGELTVSFLCEKVDFSQLMLAKIGVASLALRRNAKAKKQLKKKL
jgi:hypothetical protein